MPAIRISLNKSVIPITVIKRSQDVHELIFVPFFNKSPQGLLITEIWLITLLSKDY